jgi:hypothetical protein
MHAQASKVKAFISSFIKVQAPNKAQGFCFFPLLQSSNSIDQTLKLKIKLQS